MTYCQKNFHFQLLLQVKIWLAIGVQVIRSIIHYNNNNENHGDAQ
jgi:hypothetical protein